MNTPKTTSGYTIDGYGKSHDHRTGRRTGWVRTKGVGGTPEGASAIPGFTGTMTLEREDIEEVGGRWTVTRYYSTGDDVPASYELDVSMSNSPIETHPKFKTFATVANGAQFDATTGEFQGFFKYPVSGAMTNDKWVGVRDFLAPGAVWREITQSGSHNLSLSGIGTVQSPSGPCPGAPGGYNWIYCGGSSSGPDGNVTIRREWRLSGPQGWNAEIYS